MIPGVNVYHNEENDEMLFVLDRTERVAQLNYTIGDLDRILDEYEESVEDFDPDSFLRMIRSEPIANIEYFYIEKPFRGQHLSKELFREGLDELKEKFGVQSFVLRAYPDKGTDIEKLISIYEDCGFVQVQETEEDGIIMVKS